MDWDFVQSVAALLGYVVFIIGAAVLGAAGISFLTGALAGRIDKAAVECIMSPDQNGPPRCTTHGCSPEDQCGLLACPHCRYKSDLLAGAHGYPVEGADPRLADSYFGSPLVEPPTVDVFGAPSGRRDDIALSSQDCHPECDPDDPTDRRVLRVRFVDPLTMDFDSDVKGLREVRENLSNGDVIHYVRGETEHVDKRNDRIVFDDPSDDLPEQQGCGGRDCCGGVETP